MGILIKINKISENDVIHTYKIETEAYGGCKAFIEINTHEKNITFYDEAFSVLKKIYRQNNTDKPIEMVSTIPQAIVGRILIKAINALDTDKFPECLDYFA